MHIALVCPELHGHLNPMTTLGMALSRRGHRVTVFSTPNAEGKVGRCGLGFRPVGVKEHADGTAKAGLEKLASLNGVSALMLTGRLLRDATAIGLRDLPEGFRAEGIDGVVSDQVSPEGGCAADLLGRPLAIACNAMALHQEPGVPPVPTTWGYGRGWLARLRNRLGNGLLRAASKPIRRVSDDFRRAHKLPQYSALDDPAYALVQVAQQPPFFDYPRERLPSHFHYTGPWHAHGRDTDVPFDWDRLDARPLVYASLGTLQNRLKAVFEAILTGCSTLPVQVVLSLGRRDSTWDGPVPANAIVVPFAPQLELIRRSALVVTHAGLNTALETLAAGKPMLCLPVTNDQPGVAGRVSWLGAGELMSPKRATAERVRAAVARLMKESKFWAKAEECRDKLMNVNGAEVAAELVERALTSGTRVERAG